MSTEINEALLEGTSCNDWAPGAWTNAPAVLDEEYQPDIEPPHVNDYAAFKKHKHYRQYFRPYRYMPFPAWMYHATLEPKLIEVRDRTGAIDAEACRQAVLKLGPEWRREPYPKHQAQARNMTGKALPVKSQTEMLGEIVAKSITANAGGQTNPEALIAATVAAVMAAMNKAQSEPVAREGLREFLETPSEEDRGPQADSIERQALLELAEKEGIKVDGRWSNDRIKKAVGLT